MIFLSHSATDAELVLALQKTIDDVFRGTVRFFNTSDRNQLLLGHHWFPQITEALEQSTVVLAVLSPSGLRSPWVNFESGAASSGEPRLIPCAIGGGGKGALPPPYSHLQAIDLDDPADLQVLFATIASAVGFRLDHVDYASLIDGFPTVATDENEQSGSAETDLGHRLELVTDVVWKYRRSEVNADHLAATQIRKLNFRVTIQEVESTAFSWTPAAAIGFDGDARPAATLASSSRSTSGEVTLTRPHSRSGSRFAYKMRFDPPLKRDDEVQVEIHTDFPDYRFLYREDLVSHLLAVDEELRPYDFTSLTIENPTESFRYGIMMPKELGVIPQHVQARRWGSRFIEEEDFIAANPEVFTLGETEEDGIQYWTASLHRLSPRYRTTYRIPWKLPSRG